MGRLRNPRNLTGIYFRYQNPETNKWENWCFEDLPEEEQNKKLENRSEEWLKSMIITLARNIKDISDQFDIVNPTDSYEQLEI